MDKDVINLIEFVKTLRKLAKDGEVEEVCGKLTGWYCEKLLLYLKDLNPSTV